MPLWEDVGNLGGGEDGRGGVGHKEAVLLLLLLVGELGLEDGQVLLLLLGQLLLLLLHELLLEVELLGVLLLLLVLLPQLGLRLYQLLLLLVAGVLLKDVGGGHLGGVFHGEQRRWWWRWERR